MLRQTAEISKAINTGAVSVGPTRLQCITANQFESDKFEALVGVAHMRTHNLTEHIRFAAASRARTRASQQFKFQKRFGAIIPGNRQFVSDLLDVRWLKSHLTNSSFKEWRLSSRRGDLEIALPCSSLAKDGCAHAHQRRALLNSNLIILRHAHRKLRQLHAEFLFERIAQSPNLHKKFPGIFRFHSLRWNTH